MHTRPEIPGITYCPLLEEAIVHVVTNLPRCDAPLHKNKQATDVLLAEALALCANGEDPAFAEKFLKGTICWVQCILPDGNFRLQPLSKSETPESKMGQQWGAIAYQVNSLFDVLAQFIHATREPYQEKVYQLIVAQVPKSLKIGRHFEDARTHFEAYLAEACLPQEASVA